MTEIVENVAADDPGIAVNLTNGDGFAWGDTIEGVVTLFPHSSETVTFSLISVSIVEQDTEGFMTPVGFAGTRDPLNPLGTAALAAEYGAISAPSPGISLGETVVARDVTVSPDTASRAVPFSLVVSEHIRLTTLCYVAARAVATDGIDNDRHAAAPFVLLPPRAIQAVQNSLLTFGDFQSVEVSNSIGADNSSRFTLDYVAPANLQKTLDGVMFHLTETDTLVTGYIEINPQEKSFADHLRSFVHADRLRLPLEFPRTSLEEDGASGRPSTLVTQRLHELLDVYLRPLIP